jgi:predicted RNA polymerase sigma factor
VGQAGPGGPRVQDRDPAGARGGRGPAGQHRPALTGAADVEAAWRIESARIVAGLTRFTGDFGLAEDAAQEAVAEALVSWPLASPAYPAGWLMATTRRRAIDAIRRRTAWAAHPG